MASSGEKPSIGQVLDEEHGGGRGQLGLVDQCRRNPERPSGLRLSCSQPVLDQEADPASGGRGDADEPWQRAAPRNHDRGPPADEVIAKLAAILDIDIASAELCGRS
jgi:hypothetical protein